MTATMTIKEQIIEFLRRERAMILCPPPKKRQE